MTCLHFGQVTCNLPLFLGIRKYCLHCGHLKYLCVFLSLNIRLRSAKKEIKGLNNVLNFKFSLYRFCTLREKQRK